MSKKFFSEIYKEKNKPLILDGALGTYLEEKGFTPDEHLWFSYLNITKPKIVEQVHREYIEAGAEIITTNTFRTNPLAKKKSSIDISNNELVKRSVQLVKNVVANENILIAGSNAPAEDCYQSERTVSKFDLEYNHKKHIELLYENGVDLIWNETQSHLDEIEIISKFCFENKIPFAMNLFFTNNFKILSGESVKDIVEIISDYKPDLIGFNCIKHDSLLTNIHKINLPDNWGFYFNCGGDFKDQKIVCSITPNDYKIIVSNFIPYNPKFIGSCCGSNPNHIKEIKGFIDALH